MMKSAGKDPTIVDADSYRAKVFRWAREMGLQRVRIGVYQPKVDGAREWTIELDEFELFAKDLLDAAERVRDADAEYKVIPIENWNRLYLNPDPGNEACDFCRAMATCPAVRAKLEAAAGADFEAVPEDAAPVSANAIAAKPAVALDAAMRAVPLMEAWCKSVRAEVERRLLAGDDVPGFGLELGRQGNREWKDEAAVEELLRKTWRLPVEEVYTFKLRSPTAVEAMTKPTRDDAGVPVPPVIGDVRWGRLQDHITRADAKPSVKPKSVIKTPYNPKPAAEDYGSVIED